MIFLGVVVAAVGVTSASAAEIKLLTAGAFKQVVLRMIPAFEQERGDRVVVENDTAGALVRRIADGAAFDLVILPPAALDDLIRQGRVAAGSRTNLARVGIGVAVKTGALLPDIASVDSFKRALLSAKSVAYIDPAAGGSSGVYVASLLQRLGVADAVKPKEVLVQGGLVAQRVADGTAEICIHQISEILAVKGVTLVGPLPAEIQSYTTYAGGVGAASAQAAAARDLLERLAGPAAVPVLAETGMEPAGS
jgi:molybdate transport system substrate-binding protein